MIKTTITIDDEGVLTLPDEFIKELGWKEGDLLEWIDNKDGSFMLKKPTESVESAKIELQQQIDLRDWGTK